MQLTLPEALDGTDHGKAVTALRTYFGLDAGLTPYTGAFFERLGGGGDRGEIRDVITAEDLVAVSMLSVDIPARAALRILGTDGRRISDLLREIPTALDLVDVGPELINDSWPGWQLWDLLHGMYGIGPVTAGKLVARKRPGLLPLYDSVVAERVGSPRASGPPSTASFVPRTGLCTKSCWSSGTRRRLATTSLLCASSTL